MVANFHHSASSSDLSVVIASLVSSHKEENPSAILSQASDILSQNHPLSSFCFLATVASQFPFPILS